MPELTEPIIVIKKKKIAHGGHHGGAWKVAYADFVTAMMSLFIVLWLISSNDAVKQSVAAYFKDPRGTAKLMGSIHQGAGRALPLHKEDMHDLEKRLQEAAHRIPSLQKLNKQIEISAAPDGLEIELLEENSGTFFELGSASPKPALNDFLSVVSRELGRYPNQVSVEGHTDAVPYSSTTEYTNWELSADRANAARRIMQANGLGLMQVAEVRGFADQQLRLPDRPQDPSNRRITLIVHAEAGGAEATKTPGEASRPEQAAADTARMAARPNH